MGDELLANIFKFFRILPFIFVSYFVIIGVFGRQFKYFLVFLGLLITLGITTLLSKSEWLRSKIYTDSNGSSENINVVTEKIKKFSIFTFSSEPVSYIPLSICVYAFLLVHYLYILFAYDKTGPKTGKKNRMDTYNVTSKNYLADNWGILLFLFLLLVLDFIWYFKGSIGIMALLIPVAMGIIGGTVWALIIGRDNWAIPTTEAIESCKPSQMSYSCKMTTTGELIKS